MAETLVDLLRASVARNPQAVALAQEACALRYADLWDQVVRLARGLIARGLQPGERVALLMENSPHYAVAYYGVLAAGGVVAALNTAAKARDLANWISHCGAQVLLADTQARELAALQAALPSLEVGAVAETGFAQSTWLARTAGELPALDVGAPAAIIYTSGTTGNPKGVALSHANLAHNTRSILAYLELRAEDSILNVLPFYYSYGNSVLHTHLAVGARIVLQNSLAYPHSVLAQMAAERVSGFAGVPSTYALLLSRTRLSDYNLSALRYLTQAGGAMAPAHVQRLQEALPHVAIFVMYGQTEATARLTYLPPARLHEKLGSAGQAIPGVEIQIQDEHGQALPIGAVGEVCARGGNIMLGYWNDPIATQKVLRDGWLHTGDLARVDADGFIFIQGRSADMIKTGAHRINPKEIEEVIAEIEGVAEVAVVGAPDEILGQVIKAVVIPRPGGALTPRDVQAHCHRQLASYKIPKIIEFAAELPKTASGKVRRFMLAAHV